MGLMADMIDADLGDVNPTEMSEHFRAVAGLTRRQLSGMLGWAQQGQDGPVYELIYALLYHGPAPASGSQETPRDWFNRELHFAGSAHEMTGELEAAVGALLGWDRGESPFASEAAGPSDEQYAHAAQLIACTRNTCGGPGTGHEHLAVTMHAGALDGPSAASPLPETAAERPRDEHCAAAATMPGTAVDTSEFGAIVAAHRARWEAGDHRRLCALCEVLEPSEAHPDWSGIGCVLFGACAKCSRRKRLSIKDKLKLTACVGADLKVTP